MEAIENAIRVADKITCLPV